jgi:hypothetical protein
MVLIDLKGNSFYGFLDVMCIHYFIFLVWHGECVSLNEFEI